MNAMAEKEIHPCYICGRDTESKYGVCRFCRQHGIRHTEMKDRPALKVPPDYWSNLANEDDYDEDGELKK